MAASSSASRRPGGPAPDAGGTTLTGLPPIEPAPPASARVLVLGSMPGAASLRAGRYYAHPRNAFWPILAGLLGEDAQAPYDTLAAAAAAHGVAIWDVLHRCVRPGSLDADIVPASVQANDFAAFYARHPCLRLVCLNGRAAAALYRRHVAPRVALPPGASLHALPSTSPAHAAMARQAKQAAWHAALAPHLSPAARGPA
ncbi:DNA-deoxyinosine glycosylase [Orrella sp. JC864]|uniref:DNA-deoxyinosine glycosylase n=1 Tax=Orrella sp. JC864 TaxID=3120298 RepID=UPI0012BC9991